MDGYVFLLGGAAVSWRSCKQNCVALSTAESEYIAFTGSCLASKPDRRFVEEDSA